MAHIPRLKSRRRRLDMVALRANQQRISDNYTAARTNQAVAELDALDAELTRLTDEPMKWNKRTSPSKADRLMRRPESLFARASELSQVPEVRAATGKQSVMNDEVEVIAHPNREAMAEAHREHAVSGAPEAVVMIEAICAAVKVYSDYLDREGMFFRDDHPEDPDYDPVMVSEALVITAHPLFGIGISLKNGPLQRVYGLGIDPDLYQRNPAAPRPPSTRRRHLLDPD